MAGAGAIPFALLLLCAAVPMAIDPRWTLEVTCRYDPTCEEPVEENEWGLLLRRVFGLIGVVVGVGALAVSV